MLTAPGGGGPGGPGPQVVLPRVEGYRLQRLLGQGGAANVFLAESEADGAKVAIKMVRPEVAPILGVERFLREIRIAASITSPNLVPLLACGEADGLPFYTMPYLAEGTLRDRLTRQGQLPLAEALQVAGDLARALGALHAHGIVHRDLKPENVLIGPGVGQVQLADYGIARALSAAALEPLTTTGLVIGTPAYMSPEQGTGDPIDARSDLYAWGCVLYEMLAGEPPFGGPTAQVVIARHVGEPLPSLRISRPALPPGVEVLVRKAMAKSAADRFQSAEEVIQALTSLDLSEQPRAAEMAAPPTVRVRGPALAGVAGALLLAGAVVVREVWQAPLPLDDRRVVVFPFATQDSGRVAEGEQLALLIGSALERTEPMRWLDGWSMLGSGERRPGAALAPERARGLARRAGARYFLDGSIVPHGDSLRVVVRLHDVEEPGEPTSRSAQGTLASAPVDLALQAILDLLPRLVGIGPQADVVRLQERRTAAVILWLQGEREYRSSRMQPALALFEAALAEDSLLASAALRASMAAGWLNSDRAESLIALALRHEENLSRQERLLAAATQHYLRGNANEAIRALRLALEADPRWADAWLLAGEVQLHLLPAEGIDSLALAAVPAPRTWPLERMAAADFARSIQFDSAFTPPLTHLAEIAIRHGDFPEARRLVGTLRSAGGEPRTLSRLELAIRCAEGREPVDWGREARQQVRIVFDVGTTLAGSVMPAARDCSRQALAAVLASDTTYQDEDWSSLVLLQGMLVAEGRLAEAIAILDSAVASGLTPALGLFVLNEVAGADMGGRGRQFIENLGEDYEARGTPSLWLITGWHAAQGSRAAVERVAAVMARRAGDSGSRLDRLVAGITAAHAILARGDTTRAIEAFDALTSTAPHQAVEASLWESLAAERIILAQLLLARGQWARAHRVASVFDHPGIFIHQLFLPASLRVRERAAEALRDGPLAAAARARLANLLLDPPPARR